MNTAHTTFRKAVAVAALLSRARQHSALLVLVGLGACLWGTTPRKLDRMAWDGGIEVAVRLPEQSWPLRGELYAVDSIGALVKADALTQVPWSAMLSMDVVGFGTGFDMPVGLGMSREHRERLRLISRFPQGLHGDLLTRVLQALRQDSLLVVGSITP